MLAIGQDGNTYAAGLNFYGALGTGNTNSSTTPVKVLPPDLSITQVKFDSNNGTNLAYDTIAQVWKVTTPAHAVDSAVPVTISWTLGGSQQTDYVINSFLYYTYFNLPQAGAIPLQRYGGSALLGLSALAAGVFTCWQLIRTRGRRSRKREHTGTNN